MVEKEFKSFNDVIEAFDITPRTLRYYEYLELITPIRRGRSRFYSGRELARLRLILNGRRFGFKLEEIRQWLEMYDPESDNKEQVRIWVEMASKQITELESRRDELDKTIKDLSKLRDDAASANAIR